MGAFRADRVLPVMLMLIAGIVVVATSIADGSWITGGVFLIVLSGLTWWSWPGRRGPHISHQEAQANASGRDVIVYWRPG